MIDILRSLRSVFSDDHVMAIAEALLMLAVATSAVAGLAYCLRDAWRGFHADVIAPWRKR